MSDGYSSRPNEREGAQGACAAPGGCNCRHFAGNGDLCENCGHKYSDHW